MPGAAAPRSPSACPHTGAACREQAGEREHLSPASAQPSRAQATKPRHPPGTGFTEQPHTPENRRPCQDTRTACAAPQTCMDHRDPRHRRLASSRLPRAWHPTARAPCHAPPGQAGPARACQAAGNRSGRSRWLCQASAEPAVPPAQSPRGHGQTPNPPPREPRPSLGTWGAQAPTPGVPSLKTGTHTVLGGHCSQGTPGLSRGTPGLSRGRAQSAEIACPCPQLGGVPVPPQAGVPWPGRGHLCPCPHARRGHAGTQHWGWGGLGGQTRTVTGVGWGEWGPTTGKGAQGGGPGAR